MRHADANCLNLKPNQTRINVLYDDYGSLLIKSTYYSFLVIFLLRHIDAGSPHQAVANYIAYGITTTVNVVAGVDSHGKAPRNFSHPLVRELSLVLVVKLVLIFMIAHYFFSDPAIIDDNGQQLINHFGLEARQATDFNVKYSEERAHDQ